MTLILKAFSTLSAPLEKLPDITTGLGTTLDASTITGVAAGGNLSSWAATGPLTGWNYTAPVVGREPQYAVVDGVAAVDFVATKSAYWGQAAATAEDVAPPCTVTMLIKLKAHTSSYLTAGANVNSLLHGLWATLATTGNLTMAAIDTAGNTLTMSGPVPAGSWAVVSMVYAPTAKLYVNGVEVASGDFSTMGPRSIIPRLLIGASATAAGGYLDGYVAHIEVHERALSAGDAEVMNLHLRQTHGLS